MGGDLLIQQTLRYSARLRSQYQRAWANPDQRLIIKQPRHLGIKLIQTRSSLLGLAFSLWVSYCVKVGKKERT
jgi:hypothetical protein